MRKLVQITKHNYEEFKFKVDDDPVRGDLDLNFRLTANRSIFVLANSAYESAICVAFTNEVPTTIDELDLFSTAAYFNSGGNIAVFYTVWSKRPKAGRDLVFAVSDYIAENSEHVKRFVTLSPKTNMAYRFHTMNGASLIQENTMTDNYEYFINNSRAQEK